MTKWLSLAGMLFLLTGTAMGGSDQLTCGDTGMMIAGRSTKQPSGDNLRFGHVSPTDMDSLFSEYDRPDSPGCAVGVVYMGELIFTGAYGIANLDYGIPIRPDSRFMVASLSKQFTAASLLMMEQEGILDIDEDIRPYIPELQDLDAPITARQLMYHTSGLRDIYSLLALADIGLDNTTTREQALELLDRQQELNFTPGNEHLYSNSGYFLLSVLTGNLTGLSLGEYTKTHFFDPIGMDDTHWHDDTGRIVPNRVISYRPRPYGPGRFYRDNMARIGARGLFTTIRDFAKWEANFIENRSHLHDFSTKMTQAGFTRYRNSINYASGLRLEHYKMLRTVGHSGSYMGFRTSYMRFPEHDFAVIVFCNKSDINPASHVRQVADLYLRDVFDEQFREYTAVYQNDSLQTEFEIVSEKGDLFLEREDEEAERLIWRENERFSAGRWNIRFKRGDDNRINRFTLETPRTGEITFHRK